MKTFRVCYTEESGASCSVFIEAKNAGEAIRKFNYARRNWKCKPDIVAIELQGRKLAF